MGRSRAILFIASALALLAVAGCATTSGSPSTSSGHSADYDKGYKIGLQAFTYGLPLLVTNATYQTMTSVNVSQGAYGPVNQFNNVRSANNAKSKAVVAPGSTSLSSIAWLDLTKEPQVLHVPDVTGHYFVLAFIDPYTENIRNFGQAAGTKPGDYVICTPSQKDAKIPSGTTRVEVDYPRIWIIGSTQLNGGSADVAAVNKIQDGYTLTPLSKYGTSYTPPAPSNPTTTVTTYAVPTGIAFFDALGQQLSAFPPPAQDDPAMKTFAEVGIGPGMTPSKDSKLSSDTIAGLTAAVAAGPAQVQRDLKQIYAQDFGKHAGYLLGGFGNYGTDYKLRAVVSQIGLGAFVPQQAIYAMAWSDHDKKPLSGSSAYTLHLPSAPPANEGWSLTVYDLQGHLMPNPLNRSAFSNASKLTTNTDGSIDFYLQSAEPTDAAKVANWLPVTAGQGFEVMWRLLGPVSDKIDGILNGTGWQPPEIRPVTK